MTDDTSLPAERARLNGAREWNAPWRKWGPYLSERQWGTVREDYSQDGNAWSYFPHDHARSRAYHWGEDGLARFQRPEAAPVLRAGAVERERSDPEGAVVRADQRRGQSRRGRQRVRLLSGLHADPLIYEVALQVSARGVPVRRPDSTERAALAARLRVRADRYRRLRRRPLLRCGRRIRQVVRGGMLRSDHGDQPWA